MSPAPAHPCGAIRRRQVRFDYPAPVRLLACALACELRRRAVAQALRLPVSTVYRWLVDARRRERATPEGSDIEALVTQCERLGFFYRRRLRQAGIAIAACGAVPEPEEDGWSGGPGATRPAPGAAAVLDAVRDFIEQRYYGSLSCGQLAARAGLSKFHFIKEFHQRFGVTPYRYLLRIRIEHACRALDVSGQSPDAIALAVGFNDLSAFSKAFRAQRGESVACYLRAMQARRLAAHAVPAAPREFASLGAPPAR